MAQRWARSAIQFGSLEELNGLIDKLGLAKGLKNPGETGQHESETSRCASFATSSRWPNRPRWRRPRGCSTSPSRRSRSPSSSSRTRWGSPCSSAAPRAWCSRRTGTASSPVRARSSHRWPMPPACIARRPPSLTGPLAVGVTSLVAGYYLSELLTRYQRSCPAVQLHVVEDSRPFSSTCSSTASSMSPSWFPMRSASRRPWSPKRSRAAPTGCGWPPTTPWPTRTKSPSPTAPATTWWCSRPIASKT